MRWILLTDDHPPLDGGVATFVHEVAAGLRALGHEVLVLARHRPDLPEGVIGVRGPSFGRYGGWWTAARLWPLLRPGDRVLAVTWPVAAKVLPLLKRRGLALDVVVHGSDITVGASSARDAVLRGADRCFAMSRFLQAKVPGALVLPAPIDPLPALPSERPVHWGLIARATPLKGGERFVHLVALAGAKGVIIGDGPALPRWKALARRLEADVQFTGRLPREQVLRRLPGLDLVALLPRAGPQGEGQEGLGLSLLEAAAAGVATVGCRTGGVPEALGPGLLLEDPDDAKASVAALLAWWTPERGPAGRRWLSETHGRLRTAQTLCGAPA